MKKVALLPEAVKTYIVERGGLLSIAEQVYVVG